jgi:hypothetical protein
VWVRALAQRVVRWDTGVIVRPVSSVSFEVRLNDCAKRIHASHFRAANVSPPDMLPVPAGSCEATTTPELSKCGCDPPSQWPVSSSMAVPVSPVPCAEGPRNAFDLGASVSSRGEDLNAWWPLQKHASSSHISAWTTFACP